MAEKAAVCNEGYGRHICRAFPVDGAVDAILITAALDRAGSIVVRFSTEREYLPVAIGEHEYFFDSGQWQPPVTDENLAAQMDAYVEELKSLKQEQMGC